MHLKNKNCNMAGSLPGGLILGLLFDLLAKVHPTKTHFLKWGNCLSLPSGKYLLISIHPWQTLVLLQGQVQLSPQLCIYSTDIVCTPPAMGVPGKTELSKTNPYFQQIQRIPQEAECWQAAWNLYHWGMAEAPKLRGRKSHCLEAKAGCLVFHFENNKEFSRLRRKSPRGRRKDRESLRGVACLMYMDGMAESHWGLTKNFRFYTRGEVWSA